MKAAQTFRNAIAAQGPAKNFLVTMAFMAALAMVPMEAMAQYYSGGFNIPFIQDMGCNIVQYMKGPLAIMIFVIVVVATMVIGMIAKMDWGRIISLCVIFGVIVGLGGLLANNRYIASAAGMSGCLN